MHLLPVLASFLLLCRPELKPQIITNPDILQNHGFVVDNSTAFFVGSFISDAMSVAVYEQNVYLLESGKVSIRTFQVSKGAPFLVSIVLSFHFDSRATCIDIVPHLPILFHIAFYNSSLNFSLLKHIFATLSWNHCMVSDMCTEMYCLNSI